MNETKDWRDTFCGRERELEALVARFEEVAGGKGPRIAVVLGDRGMGKTRLVQELYRVLATRHDPLNYWPDASLFAGNNLRVAPDLADATVRSHFEGFKLADRPMPFLWWGFRLSDPDVRNAARSDMAAHRATLDLHLAPVRYARQLGAARERVKQAGVDAASELGKNLLKAAVSAIPGVASASTVIELLVDYAGKGKDAAEAARDEMNLRAGHRQMNLLQSEAARSDDIHERTLDDLSAVLAPAKDAAALPVIVYCDDAQFAREGGDEGALRFLTALWQRAHLADWPLLLVLTHWGVEWHRVSGDDRASCATELRGDAGSAQFGLTIDLPKEPALAGLVTAGLPGLPADDAMLLLGKADGNPQVLIELVDLVRRSPAWRKAGSGELTPHARREIERRATRLAELILDRLESDATPEAVRQAVALSSVQGMEFLCTLTDAAARAFELGGAAQGLKDAEHPHRLVVGVEEGVAGFVQRAYREAAASLVGTHVGDPKEVERALLDAAMALVDNADRFSGLTPNEQQAAWGVMVGLAEEHADGKVRRFAGQGLLRLVAAALQHERGADYARAAELALRFEAGLGKRWRVGDFELSDILWAVDGIVAWLGASRVGPLLNAVVARAAEQVKELGTPAARRTLLSALHRAGAVALARGDPSEAERLSRSGLETARALAEGAETDDDAKRDLAASLDQVGDVIQGLGRWLEAEDLFRESLGLRIELATPLVTSEARRDMSLSLDRLGDVARRRGDLHQAGEYYREGLEIRRDLATLATPYGLTQARRGISLSLNRVGQVAQVQGNWSDAEKHLGEGLAISRQLAANLGTPMLLRDVGAALCVLAAVSRERGDSALSCELLREARPIFDELAARLKTPQAQEEAAALRQLLTDQGCNC